MSVTDRKVEEKGEIKKILTELPIKTNADYNSEDHASRLGSNSYIFREQIVQSKFERLTNKKKKTAFPSSTHMKCLQGRKNKQKCRTGKEKLVLFYINYSYIDTIHIFL